MGTGAAMGTAEALALDALGAVAGAVCFLVVDARRDDDGARARGASSAACAAALALAASADATDAANGSSAAAAAAASVSSDSLKATAVPPGLYHSISVYLRRRNFLRSGSGVSGNG